MQGPVAARLGDGRRLHLQHGPIDLIIEATGAAPAVREAHAAAVARFDGLLEALVSELPVLRARLRPVSPLPDGPVARRMVHAARPVCAECFVTPMAAVAGAVADEMLTAMTTAAPLDKAYVNNGGDVAIHLAPGETFSAAMFAVHGSDLGRLRLTPSDGIAGMATSGQGGRSLSLGIADSVTVLAECAARADVAATLIANAVDLPDHPGIAREAASALQPDSDLGDRLVVTGVPNLSREEKEAALRSGAVRATRMIDSGLIKAAALFLQGGALTLGEPLTQGESMSHYQQLEGAGHAGA